jgi:hypothetical protein
MLSFSPPSPSLFFPFILETKGLISLGPGVFVDFVVVEFRYTIIFLLAMAMIFLLSEFSRYMQAGTQ